MAGKHRSWWGWGHVEDAVTGAEATSLADRVRALLPGVDLTEHVAPPVAELGLRPPRVDPPTSLARLCSTDPADRAAHTHGKAFRDVVRNLQGTSTTRRTWWSGRRPSRTSSTSWTGARAGTSR